jgi:hypothetical protein
MFPTRRKRGAMKGVNSTYITHMHSLGLGLWLVAPFIQVFDLALNTMQCMSSYFPCPQLHTSFSNRNGGNTWAFGKEHKHLWETECATERIRPCDLSCQNL